MVDFNRFNSASYYINMDFKINQIIITTDKGDYNDDDFYNVYMGIFFRIDNKRYTIDYKYVGSGGYDEIKIYDNEFNDLDCDFLVDIILQNKEVQEYYNEFKKICSKLN